MSAAPEFSVIVPVCHGGGLLRDSLASLRALKAPPGTYEVVVAVAEDDAESRRTIEEAAAGSPVRWVTCGTHNRSAMLNAAWRTARGRVLAFTDDDACAPPQWPAGLLAALEDGTAGVVGGPDEHPGGGRAFDAALSWVLESLVPRSGLRGRPRSGGPSTTRGSGTWRCRRRWRRRWPSAPTARRRGSSTSRWTCTRTWSCARG